MTITETTDSDKCTRLKLAVRGAVQGVGFRPFVHRLATELSLAGRVHNSPQGVCIEVEGPPPALKQFFRRLETEKPPGSFIQGLEASWLDAVGYKDFQIGLSETSGERTALVLPDIATCPDCRRDIFDPRNRRYGYPFTNCTHCGPRFSIIEALPYDRANTSMRGFQMCSACRAEYDDPRDRRFHAQPNACPACGPQLELWRATGETLCGGQDAVLAVAQAIGRGQIVAVNGIGGFHLLVDARNGEAIRRLRERKQREEKPFALMFPSLETARAVCEISPLEERLLGSPAAPIVLLRRIANHKSQIANSVAPGNPNLGVMLPSNPIHHLLMAELGFPVVATSGNLSDESLCTDPPEALERLRGIADGFLIHNRPIVRPVDDSIVRVMLDREMVLRRARGYAPLPVQMPNAKCKTQSILAVGAHLKNAVALAVGDNVFVSQHIGDLETEQANRAFRRVVADLPKFYATEPDIIAADLHPDYLSTRFALEKAAQGCLRHTGVQHHLAHVLSCMAENEVELPALGVAWDGTGYGLDGTIWGGEFLLITPDTAERVAHLRPFRLPGGEAAVKEPRRAAAGLLYEMFGGYLFDRTDWQQMTAFSEEERTALKTMLARRLNSPWCGSAGRLFDAVASLAGLRQKMRFEGQAAMELEFAIEGAETDAAYEFAAGANSRPISSPTMPHAPDILDWSPMIRTILGDVQRGVGIGEISAKFHNALAEGVVQVAHLSGCKRVALSGGCFQNRYLTERTVRRLRQDGFRAYWHQRVPTNDGGIALGQVFAARHGLTLRS